MDSTRIGRRQRGSALAIGLILLLVLTVLAVASVGSATNDVRMAANSQFARTAFEAQQRGSEVALQTYAPDTRLPTVTVAPVTFDTTTSYTYTVAFNAQNGYTEVPGGGYSIGEGMGFKAIHFDVTSTGKTSGGTSTTATQSFYIVGPP